MANFQNEADVGIPARVNGERTVEFVSNIVRWVREGRVFTASQGVEAVDIATVSTEADVTPTCALQAPSSGIAVIPLRVFIALTDDGGGLSKIDLSFTKAAAACATAMTLTGTDLNVQNHYTTNPQEDAQATAIHGVTASALTTTDYITLAHGEAVNAALTSGLMKFSDVFDYQFNYPLILVEKAALLIHGYSGTSAGAIVPVITWAEVPIAELV